VGMEEPERSHKPVSGQPGLRVTLASDWEDLTLRSKPPGTVRFLKRLGRENRRCPTTLPGCLGWPILQEGKTEFLRGHQAGQAELDRADQSCLLQS